MRNHFACEEMEGLRQPQLRKSSSGSGRQPSNVVGTFKGSAKQDSEFRCLHWGHHRCHSGTCRDFWTQRLFSSFSKLDVSSLSGCWSPPHSESLFCLNSAGTGLVMQKSFSTRKFPLVFILSLVILIAPFHALQETETLWQVLAGKVELGPCRFQQKPPRLTSLLSHPFPQILARSKTHPTRQMFPLNLGMSTKPLRKGPQMKSKLSCLLPLTNREKKKTQPKQTAKQQRMQECDHLGTIRYLLFLLIKSVWTAVASRNMCAGAGIPIVKW